MTIIIVVAAFDERERLFLWKFTLLQYYQAQWKAQATQVYVWETLCKN